MSVPLPGETLEYIKPSNQFIFDSVGNLIGIQNPRANGADLRTIDSMTWANRPTSMVESAPILFTDVGSSGTLMRYAGGRWRPIAGQAKLASLGAAVSGITNSETIVLQSLIPAGAWQDNDVIRVWISTTKSGTTDSLNLTIRVGTAGTTADTALTGFNAFALMGTAALSGGSILEFKLVSATSALKTGSAGANTGSFNSSSNGTSAGAATTITDASANALYVSVSLASSGASNTVAVQTCQIEMLTP